MLFLADIISAKNIILFTPLVDTYLLEDLIHKVILTKDKEKEPTIARQMTDETGGLCRSFEILMVLTIMSSLFSMMWLKLREKTGVL